jgi:hypothetical protein
LNCGSGISATINLSIKIRKIIRKNFKQPSRRLELIRGLFSCMKNSINMLEIMSNSNFSKRFSHADLSISNKCTKNSKFGFKH